MASVPPASVVVAHLALLEASVTAEQPLSAAPFEVKLTEPVGDDPPLTVAVKVTDAPNLAGLVLEVRLVVVARPTICDSMPLLPELLLSPE